VGYRVLKHGSVFSAPIGSLTVLRRLHLSVFLGFQWPQEDCDGHWQRQYRHTNGSVLSENNGNVDTGTVIMRCFSCLSAQQACAGGEQHAGTNPYSSTA
jgi:hypothetical protein